VILPGGQRGKESELQGFLQATTWVEFRGSIDDEQALHRLACGIKGIPPGRRPGDTIQLGECPYVGLKTFQPEDAGLFFGRIAKIQEPEGGNLSSNEQSVSNRHVLEDTFVSLSVGEAIKS